jgi:hypothetical protein
MMPDKAPEESEPIAVRFPLAGEWCAVNTPGHKVPSHGTDLLGQTYAYDFLQIDWSTRKGYKFYNQSVIRSVLLGVRLENTYCWSKPIFSPFDGEVIEANDGVKERNPVHMIRDLVVVVKNALTFSAKSNEELLPLLGNHIILKGKEAFALIAHARRHSIVVSPGDVVQEGQPLAEVGHSGNSTAPHLHFQLMDRAELLEARGLPCCFKNYQRFDGDKWQPVTNGIPGRRERISA